MGSLKTAIVTGASGQDGSLTVDFLLRKGYYVYAVVRPTSIPSHFVQTEVSNVCVWSTDILDVDAVGLLLEDACRRRSPDWPVEIYHYACAKQGHVSLDFPFESIDSCVRSVTCFLEAIRSASDRNSFRFFYASSSEIYGGLAAGSMDEMSPAHPESPYAIGKLAGMNLCRVYREKLGVFACSGILFNHESCRRNTAMVTRKITQAVAARKLGKSREPLVLGNLNAARDWSHAGDFVAAIHAMLQLEGPDDFVLASGQLRTVRQFVEAAFTVVGIQVQWSGSGVDEVGTSAVTGEIVVQVSEKFFRPLADRAGISGVQTKARNILGWIPQISFEDMVEEMVTEDIQLLMRNA